MPYWAALIISQVFVAADKFTWAIVWLVLSICFLAIDWFLKK